MNRWRLPNAVYVQQLPWLHRDAFSRATILKSEQTGAARAAVAVSGHFGKRLIARSGFSLALFAQYDPAQYSESYDDILALEKTSFEAAQQIVVTTDEMRATAIKTHHLSPDKIRVIPNYVDTAHFSPAEGASDAKPRIVFAGRLVDQKNVENLLEAVAPMTGVQVDFIGDGPLREKLAARIADDGWIMCGYWATVPMPSYRITSARQRSMRSHRATKVIPKPSSRPWPAARPYWRAMRPACVSSLNMAKRAGWLIWMRPASGLACKLC